MLASTERFAIAVGGVADGNVQFAKMIDHQRDHLLHGLLVRHIRLHLDRLGTAVADGPHDLLRLVAVRVVIHGNLSAGPSQCHTRCSANAQAPSGH